jgi:hypothetical protein
MLRVVIANHHGEKVLWAGCACKEQAVTATTTHCLPGKPSGVARDLHQMNYLG